MRVRVDAAEKASTLTTLARVPTASATEFLIKSPPPDVPRSPTGAAFLWRASPEFPYYAAIDSDGVSWAWDDSIMPAAAPSLEGAPGEGHIAGTVHGWHSGGRWSPVTGPSLNTKIDAFVRDVVIPLMATVAGALIGGSAGAAAAFAITTMNKLARGVKITQVLADAAYDQLKTTYERSTWKKTYEDFRSMPYSAKAIDAARSEVAKRYYAGSASQEQALAAFDSAGSIGRASKIQEIAVRELHRRLPTEDGAVLDHVLENGGLLAEWAYAYGGVAALTWLDAILANVTVRMDAGEFS